MALGVPPEGSAAREAFLSQGPSLPGEAPAAYVGVDRWFNPRQSLPAGMVFAQFDHRPPAEIHAAQTPVSNFFTDEETARRYQLPSGEMDSRRISEALQLKPYRSPTADKHSAHSYGARLVLYTTLRPVEAQDVMRTRGAEFSHGRTRNNIHLGNGSAPQYYLPKAKTEIQPHEAPLFRVQEIIECDKKTLSHRLTWLKDFENQGKTNRQVNAAIKGVFNAKVKELLKSSLPQEQAHGQQIKGLVEANLKVKQENRANILMASGAKLPIAPPALKAPVAKPAHRRGPRH